MQERVDKIGRVLPPNKPKGKEMEQRAAAFAAARHTMTNSVTGQEAATLFNTNRAAVSEALIILMHGTEQEIEDVTTGRLGMKNVTTAIRQRNKTPGKRLQGKKVTISANQTETMRHDSAVFAQLRQALEAICGMPQPKDVAALARKNGMRTDTINRHLMTAFSWITEFSDEWTK